MSGGSLNYLYQRIQDGADMLGVGAHGRKDWESLASFAGFLQRLAELCRSIEYDLSGDSELSRHEYDDMGRLVKALQALEATSSAPLSAAKGPDLPPQSSQEEGPAGVDLEAIEERFNVHGDLRDAPSGHRVVAQLCAEVRRLRAQAPASSPRDLEAALNRVSAGLLDDRPDYLTRERAADMVLLRKAIRAAHPPKGETPSEAAGGVDLESVLARGAHLTLQAIQREIPPNDADRSYDDTVIQEFRSLKAKLTSAEKRIEDLETTAPGTPIEKAAREYVIAAMKQDALVTEHYGLLPREEAIEIDRAADSAWKKLRDMITGYPPEGREE